MFITRRRNKPLFLVIWMAMTNEKLNPAKNQSERATEQSTKGV